MKARNVLLWAVAGTVVPLATLAHAANLPSQIGQDYANKVNSMPELAVPVLSLDPEKTAEAQAAANQVIGQTTPKAPESAPVLTLDAGGSASRIHGFGDMQIDTQYITPRGLVAVESSPQFHTLFGLVFDLYHGDGFINGVSVVGGIWSDLNPHPDKSVVTGADVVAEVDLFAGVNVKFLDKWQFAYTIQAWTFPDLTAGHNEIDPTTEYNMDFKFSFDDSSYFKDGVGGINMKGFGGFQPYVDIFWNFAGDSSPVVANALLGKNDHTFYVELGLDPSYTWDGISDLPITFSMPTYVQVGDSSFWGETPSGNRSNIGLFSTGLKISAPLNFIPKDFGSWNAYVGVSYYHTCNPALTYINSGTGADSNLVLGYAGIGFGF